MYLTRIPINPRRRDSDKMLGSRQVLHASIESLFPPLLDGAKPTRKLWRLDRDGDANWVYLVSEERPDTTSMVEAVGWPMAEHQPEPIDYSRALSKLAAGQTFSFRVDINPVKSASIPASAGLFRANGKRKSGTILPIHGEEAQLAWFESKAENLGFTIIPGATEVTRSTVEEFSREGSRVAITLATITGKLEVVDPQTFRQTLTSGFGRAKAYGAGLITIASV